MSKFCINCGTRLDDDVLFCINCGTRQDYAPAPAAPVAEPAPAPVAEPVTELITEPVAAPVAEPAAPVMEPVAPAVPAEPVAKPASKLPFNLSKNMLIAIGAGVVALILVVVLVLSLMSPGYVTAIENVTAPMSGNFENYRALAPEKVWEYLEHNGNSYAEILEEAKEDYEDGYSKKLYGANAQFDFEITNEIDLPQGQVEKIARYLYDEFSIMPTEVTEAKRVFCEVTVTSDTYADIRTDSPIYVVKISGEWYAVDLNYNASKDVWEVSFPVY